MSIWAGINEGPHFCKVEDIHNDQMLVTNVQSPSKITMVSVTDFAVFRQINTVLQEFYNNQSNCVKIPKGLLRKGNLSCVVKVHDLWYRGRTVGYSSELHQVQVRYLDADGLDVFQEDQVFFLYKDLGVLHGITFNFVLSNVTPRENALWSFNSCLRLRQLIHHKVVKISVDTKADNNCLGRIQFDEEDVGNILFEEGFVKKTLLERRILQVETLTFRDNEEGYISDNSEFEEDTDILDL